MNAEFAATPTTIPRQRTQPTQICVPELPRLYQARPLRQRRRGFQPTSDYDPFYRSPRNFRTALYFNLLLLTPYNPTLLRLLLGLQSRHPLLRRPLFYLLQSELLFPFSYPSSS